MELFKDNCIIANVYISTNYKKKMKQLIEVLNTSMSITMLMKIETFGYENRLWKLTPIYVKINL